MELLNQGLKKIKAFYGQDRKGFFLLAAVLVLGLALRLSFINATDITMDEAFFVAFSYKIAYLLWSAPVVALGLALAGIAVFYLVAVRRSLAATALILASILAAKYGFGIPYLTHAVGPGFLLAVSSVIYLTGLLPNIAGELVSVISMVGLAFVGLYFGRRVSKAAGLIAFAFVMLSPYNVFISTTSFLGPFGWFLCFLSLALFFEGQKNPKLLPLAGLVAAAGYATRFPTMVTLPVFLFFGFSNRETLLKGENWRNAAIFFALLFSTAAFFTPLVWDQVSGSASWQGYERWDLIEIQMSSFVQGGTPDVASSHDPLFIPHALSLFYTPWYLVLLAFSVPFSVWVAWKEKDSGLGSLLFVGLVIFLLSMSMVIGQQRANRLLAFDFAFLLSAAVALGYGKRLLNAKKILALGFAALFLFASFSVVVQHDFKGISAFVGEMPEGSVVFIRPGAIVASYYLSHYRYDVGISKPLFDRFFQTDLSLRERFEELKGRVIGNIEKAGDADYVLFGTALPEGEKQEILEGIEGFKKCRPVENGGIRMYEVYAKRVCFN